MVKSKVSTGQILFIRDFLNGQTYEVLFRSSFLIERLSDIGTHGRTAFARLTSSGKIINGALNMT